MASTLVRSLSIVVLLVMGSGDLVAAAPSEEPRGTPAAGRGPAAGLQSGEAHGGGSPELVAVGEPGLRPGIDAALGKARIWLDRLTVNAAQLQTQGVKGKKKVGEILAAYLDLYLLEESGPGRERILERVRAIASQTSRPSWHNLTTCDDTEFTQNSMSYLRVLRLMEKFGLETSSYKEELLKARPRFDGHFAGRGAWQRAVFAGYYRRFGLELPEVLAEADQGKGILALRLSSEIYSSIQAYQLTHQVFAAFDYGHRRTQDRFTGEELEFLAGVFPGLVERAIRAGDPDLLAEFLSSMAYLGFQEDRSWPRGMAWLLEAQKPDGSWGVYERAVHGPFVEQKLTLHTVGVSIQALVAARRTQGRAGRPQNR